MGTFKNIALAEDENISLFIVKFYQFKIQNVTQLHMHDDNFINQSIYVKIYSVRMN